jgi:hypothetical protein
LLRDEKARVFDGGWAKEATVKNFPASQNIGGVEMLLKPVEACEKCTGIPTLMSGNTIYPGTRA